MYQLTNMIVDFGGVKTATKMPFLDTVNGFKQGDILFSNIRTYFKKIWRATFDGGCSADVLVFRSKNEKIMSNDFLYRVLTNRSFTEYTIKTSKGVKMPRGDKLSIMNYRFYISDKDEQQRIVDVLSSFDDKIENNLAMNKTLENIAKTLFKSWFVNFDPVHALARGENKDAICKRLYIDKDTLALFPDTFNAQGLPMGWEMKPFEHLINKQHIGKKFDNKTAMPIGKVPILDQGKSGIMGFHNEDAGFSASFDKPIAVFADHTCHKRLIYYPFSAIQSIFAYYGKDISTIWLHYASLDVIVSSGYKRHMAEFMAKTITVPSNSLDKKYEEIAMLFLHKIWQNEQENQTLTQMRDILLSELISGRVRVKA